jgi:hypothetical protein
MLFNRHQQVYKDFVTVLGQLQEHLYSSSGDFESFKRGFQAVEMVFQEEILSLTLDGLEADQVSRWQLAHTEIHRAFRLLKTDFLFLVSAKREIIMQQRIRQFGDRLLQLISDCEMLLEFFDLSS